MTKTPSANPYPTPQTSRQRLKPALQLDPPSPTRSTGSSDTLVSTHEPVKETSNSFEIQDVLVRFNHTGVQLPIPKFVTLGAQSAGKSSVLSALLNLTLWSAPGKATFGATWINSRQTSGPFHAEIWIQFAMPAAGVAKRVQFTLRAIEDKKQLEQALKLAGEEARRSVDGSLNIRTFEALCKMSSEEQQLGHKDWARLTANTVVLHVRGPEQPDLTVVDLPGLIRDGEAQLADLYLRDKHNMILYCLPAMTQPSETAVEMKLIKKYSADSGGLACVITKADLIQSPVDEDPLISLALAKNPDLSLDASLGWYSVRLRKRDEAKQGTSAQIVQMAEAALFAQPEWRALQGGGGVTLGIAQTRCKLLQLFARRVKANIPVLRRRMEEERSALEERLSRLPPVVENPIGDAHDLIIDIAGRLEDVLYTQNDYTGRLLDAQQAFKNQLKATIPVFIATFRPTSDETVVSSTATPQAGLCVYLDDTLPAIRKNTSARTDAANLDRVRSDLRQRRCLQWPTLCRAYVQQVWDIANQAVETIVSDVCAERNAQCAELPGLLAASQASFKAETLDMAQRLCQSELTDPLHVSLPSPHIPVYDETRKRLRTEFAEAFGIPPASPTPEHLDDHERRAPDIVAAKTDGRLTWVERKRCLDVEATLATTLDRGRHRLADVVGRQAQVGLKEWSRQVVRSLRRDMGLEELDTKTRKRAREIFEPDPEVAEERARCLGQLKVFQALQSKLQS